MNTRPLYIFDLDGTLALIEHRRHFVERPKIQSLLGPAWKPQWDAFHAACLDDLPNKPIISIMDGLLNQGHDVLVFSDRSDVVRNDTVAWLSYYTDLGAFDVEACLTMRPVGDFTPDDVLKKSWYDGMLQEDKDRLVAVFDDRDRVVAMWRSLGITCLQVAPGEF